MGVVNSETKGRKCRYTQTSACRAFVYQTCVEMDSNNSIVKMIFT